MNSKSPTALVIALLAIVLVFSSRHIGLGVIGNTLCLLVFIAAAFMSLQRHMKN